ncbi:chondrolectin [Callorhinchus milii]|uniref:chondrolectin n=1 Tax=Callorhinchus milii TaxID=7868 RepID=UPI0004574A5B|nr:chondrolectin [Callorhinchus milii]|eukprot:gi/632983128/ref/XP_007908493.1/ PREDICTED: chondrolectin [Callorhinchus milii]
MVLNLTWSLDMGRSSRVQSGQTVCTSGSEHPCYKIAYFQELSRRVGFKEASQACRMDGGSLTSVESLEEQSLIEGLLQDLAKSASGISDGDFWIGLSRGGEERGHASLTSCPDLYRWTDGSAAKFRNWYTDEPSCGSEACVVMYHQLSAHPGLGGPYLYQWNDDRCNMKHNFICKYAAATVLGKEPVEKPEADYEIIPTEAGIKLHRPNKSEEMAMKESSGIMPNVVYVIIPTIPLLLLLIVALATCCFQMLGRSKQHTKSSSTESTLWISQTPKKQSQAIV